MLFLQNSSRAMLRRTSHRCISNFDCHPSMAWPFSQMGTHTPKKNLEKILQSKPVITTASNGVKIISQDLNEPVAAIGVYNKQAGAKYDPREKPGLNYVMRCSLMLSNMEDSMFQFDKQLRSVGASFEHEELHKKYLGWKVEVQRDSYKSILSSMCNGCTVPRFQSVEIDRYRDQMDNIYEEYRFKTPRKYCIERLERVAFYKEPPGQSRYVLPASNDYCSPDSLLNHFSVTFRPENIILAGVNVEHTDLVSAYESAEYRLLASAPHHAAAVSSAERARIDAVAVGESKEAEQYQEMSEVIEYEKRHEAMSTNPLFIEETIFAIGWCTDGRADINTYTATLVAQEYLNIALGSATRQRDSREQDIEPFYSFFETAGLLGMTARVYPGDAHLTQRKILETFKNAFVADRHELAVQRAVLRFFSEHLELRRDYLDLLVTQEESLTATAFMDALRSVQPKQVKNVFQGCCARKPSQFATGMQSSLVSLTKYDW